MSCDLWVHGGGARLSLSSSSSSRERETRFNWNWNSFLTAHVFFSLGSLTLNDGVNVNDVSKTKES